MTRTFPTLEHEIYVLDDTEAKNIAHLLQERNFAPFATPQDFERFVTTSFEVVKLLPAHIIEVLLTFRRSGNKEGVVVIRNLPIDDLKIGPTPQHWSQSAQTKHYFETEMYLLGVTSLLGEPFAFDTQHGGNVVQNIVPVRADQEEQIGTGGKFFLEWHTEDAFHDFHADFIGLLCLRGNPNAATTFASIRNMHIPEHYKRQLFIKQFYAGIDKAHGGTGRAEDGNLIAILEGSYEDPTWRLDTSCVVGQNPAAQEALSHLINEMDRVARQFVLQPGDLLLMDNKYVVHGRTAFTPRFDGTDRWLQRVSIAADLRKSNAVRLGSQRVIHREATSVR